MGCKNCKKNKLEEKVNIKWGTLAGFIFVVVFFVYGLITFYFDILGFFS